jgi:hypothetical protein
MSTSDKEYCPLFLFKMVGGWATFFRRGVITLEKVMKKGQFLPLYVVQNIKNA